MKSEKKSGAERTQLAVRDEWWSDERIQSFMALEAAADEAADFHTINKAYHGMIPEAFERFIEFFLAAGRNLDQTNVYGQTNLGIISEHKNSTDYAEILKKAGATA